MTGFISNIIWNSVEGFVDAGKRTAGEYGGNALIKAGDMIENSGRSVGNGIEKKASSYGTAISGQTYKPSVNPLPSTARKPAMKRSNSTPASNKPATSGVPLGAKKYPGSNQVQGDVGGAKKTVGGVNKTVGSVTGGGQKALGGATRSIPPFKGPGSTSTANKPLSKSFPDTKGLSKTAYPTGKKTAVRCGQPKPFTPPVEQKKPGAKKAYPGTNTLPGQSRTPVQQQKHKPLPKLGPQVGQGQTMQHIAV